MTQDRSAAEPQPVPCDSIIAWPATDRRDGPHCWAVKDTCGRTARRGLSDTEALAREHAQQALDELQEDSTVTLEMFTVVGFTDDRFQNRVEYIFAVDAEQAAIKACEQKPTLQVVAVFAGRVVDQLASESACRWPLAEEDEGE